MSLAAWATLSMCLAPQALAQNPSGGLNDLAIELVKPEAVLRAH